MNVNVNKKFAAENVRLWLNRLRNFGGTEKEATELVRASFAPSRNHSAKFDGHGQRPVTRQEVANSFGK
jgi:hypothetical protein